MNFKIKANQGVMLRDNKFKMMISSDPLHKNAPERKDRKDRREQKKKKKKKRERKKIPNPYK